MRGHALSGRRGLVRVARDIGECRQLVAMPARGTGDIAIVADLDAIEPEQALEQRSPTSRLVVIGSGRTASIAVVPGWTRVHRGPNRVGSMRVGDVCGRVTASWTCHYERHGHVWLAPSVYPIHHVRRDRGVLLTLGPGLSNRS
jgi:hypothetical protein